MNPFKRQIGLIPWLVVGSILCWAPACRGGATYAYTGQPFDDVGSSILPCPDVCGLSGWFSVALPLPANMPFGSISPIAFSFTDGQVTLDDSNVIGSDYGIFASTDGLGQINTWEISLAALVPSGAEYTILESFDYVGFSGPLCNGDCVSDFVIQYNTGPNQVAGNGSTPGTWTLVPEPSTVCLLGIGLMGIAALRRPRRCANPRLSTATSVGINRSMLRPNGPMA